MAQTIYKDIGTAGENLGVVLHAMSFDPIRLAQLIDEKFESRAAFAVAAKVSENTVTNWCSGYTTPSIDQVVNCAKILGTTVGFLVRETEDSTPLSDAKTDRFAKLREQFKGELPDEIIEETLSGPFWASLNQELASEMSREELDLYLEEQEYIHRLKALQIKKKRMQMQGKKEDKKGAG